MLAVASLILFDVAIFKDIYDVASNIHGHLRQQLPQSLQPSWTFTPTVAILIII